MIKLYTELQWPAAEPRIDYDSNLLLLGSCFSENIGSKLEYFKFRNCVNPFGIIFHPHPIYSLLKRAADEVPFTSRDVFEFQDRWYSFKAHSSLNSGEEKRFVKLLNDRLDELRDRVRSASHIILTYGTAWGYRHRKSGELVANCHKIAAANFEKELSTTQELENILKDSVRAIRRLNRDAVILFTVSPVRHIKDGIVENNRSKAHLLTAVHQVIQGTDRLHYFPAYELMMDVLRDYRFYTEDLIHPNEVAIKMIWERFEATWLDPDAAGLQAEIARIQKGLQHRAFNPDSREHRSFIKDLESRIEAVKKILPHVEF